MHEGGWLKWSHSFGVFWAFPFPRGTSLSEVSLQNYLLLVWNVTSRLMTKICWLLRIVRADPTFNLMADLCLLSKTNNQLFFRRRWKGYTGTHSRLLQWMYKRGCTNYAVVIIYSARNANQKCSLQCMGM